MRKQFTATVLVLMLFLFGLGCQTQHKVETVHKVQVEPMHITIDINIKVDKALDDFFGDLDAAEDQIQQPAQDSKTP
jgi:cell division protein FtsX